MEKDAEQIFSLHRYWVYADRLKQLASEEAEKLKRDQISKGVKFEDIPIYTGDLGIFHGYSLSALYVVAEGYLELGLHDEIIDSLWDEKNINLLRLFRNGTFHYQKDYYSEKILNLDTSKNFSPWVKAFHLQMGIFLSRELTKKTPKDIAEKVKALNQK